MMLCNFWDSPYWTPVTCEKITNNIVSFNSLGVVLYIYQ